MAWQATCMLSPILLVLLAPGEDRGQGWRERTRLRMEKGVGMCTNGPLWLGRQSTWGAVASSWLYAILSMDTKGPLPEQEPVFSSCCGGWGLSNLKGVFLGSCAQDTELLQTTEGETVSVKCRYGPSQRFREKIWCRKISEGTCKILWSSVSTGAARRPHTIRDNPESYFFTVTMTALKMKDSGTYYCGVAKDFRSIMILRDIFLLVLKDSVPSPTSQMTTAMASAPVTDSWMWKVIIACVAVAVLLLFGLVLLVVLYLRKARGRAQTVENECHHVYEDLPEQKKKTGFDQQTLPNEDTAAICYASLIHLNHMSYQGSIYGNTQPSLKPSPDPLLSVEYASISRNRLVSVKATAPEAETRG